MNRRSRLLLCLALSGAAVAQQPSARPPGASPTLAEQVAAAVAGDDWSQQLQRLGLEQRPIAEIVDALAALRSQLHDPRWSRAMSLVAARGSEVETLWRSEPDRRRARAGLFAAARGDWAWLYREATDQAERADIEAIARHLAPRRHHPELQGALATHAEYLAAAIALQRIAIAATQAGPNPYLAQLRSDERDGADLVPLLGGYDGACSPFHLVAALGDSELRVRARAAAALRRLLRLELTPWLAEALRNDPTLAARQFAARCSPTQGVMQDAEIERILAQLAADDVGSAIACSAQARGLGAAVRGKLAQALIDAGLRVAVDAAPATPRRPFAGARAVSPAVGCFAAAASLGTAPFQLVLAAAVNARDGEVAARVMTGLANTEVVPDVDLPDARAAVRTLLEHPLDEVAKAACALAARLLAKHDDAALRGKLGDLALAALAAHATTVAFEVGNGNDFVCGTPPRPLGPPATRAAAAVYAAAVLGEARLVAPLLAEQQRLPAAGGDPLHRLFVMHCLGAIAHLADAAQARSLHERFGAPANVAYPYLDADAQLRLDLVFGLYPVVPAELLPSYRPLLAEASAAQAFAIRLDRVWESVSEDRAKLALAMAKLRPADGFRLRLRAPAVLVERWQAGGADREQTVACLRNLWPECAERIVALAREARLPRELVAASLPSTRLPLPLLAQVLPQGAAEAAAWAAPLAAAIERATAGDADTDLQALQALAASVVAEVARTAAQRAASLGAPGQAVARDAFLRLVAAADAADAAAALRLAVLAGIELPGLTDLVSRLRASAEWFPRMVADAAALRFLAADPARGASGCPAEALLLAGREVDTATLRQAFGDDARLQVTRLLQAASGRLLTQGLQLAGELPWWDLGLEQLVTRCTGDADPQVRRAAYEALRSRDAGLWPCALLVHEAQFDPDPAVQACARPSGR